MGKTTTPLAQCRIATGLSARAAAQLMGIDPTGLIRVENGTWSPRQDTARKIYDLYRGLVPLGLIYDPTHEHWTDWLTENRRKKLEGRGRRLRIELEHRKLRR